jgi:hypothetical protein
LEQNIHGLTHHISVTETFEQLIDDYAIHNPACLKDETKGRKAMLQAAHAAETADEAL